MRRRSGLRFFFTGVVFGIFYLLSPVAHAQFSQGLIIDHTCTDISRIPAEWINRAKRDFRISYGHTSHGSQIVSGMNVLKGSPGSLYWFDHDGTQGGLSLHDYEPDGDLGNPDRTSWAERTRALLSGPGNRNLVMWSWCGQVDGSSQEIAVYLNLMNQLERDFPHVRFIYMTGHLDGNGQRGNVNERNNQIRQFCRANNKVLFDFADIESYDPDGDYFLDKGANDNCDYWDGGTIRNWAQEWCAAHGGKCSSCDCAHSQSLNCDLKGRAFWWMLARLAGWSPCPLPAPSNLTAQADSRNRQVSLTWLDNSSITNENSFIIQRKAADSAWNNYYASVPANYSSFVDRGLAAGVYSYRVVAHLNNDGSGHPCDSPCSNVCLVEIGDASARAPEAASNLTASPDSANKTVSLSWTDNSSSETGFIVQRQIDGGAWDNTYATVGTQTTSYTDNNRGIGTLVAATYTYRIVAFNGYGQSVPSNEASGTICQQAPVPVPTADPPEFTSELPVSAGETHTITLKQGVNDYTGCQDTYLDSELGDENFGENCCDPVRSNPRRHFIISFDLPPEVMNKKIASARIVFYCWYVDGWRDGQCLKLYRVTQDWDEKSATWKKRMGGSLWNTAGGTFDPALLGCSPIPDGSYYPEFTITDLVQQWANGSRENYGLILVNDTVMETGIKTSNYEEYGRPYLEITYVSEQQGSGQNTCYRDSDKDGYGDAGYSIQAQSAPAGYVGNNTDCDDSDPAVHPGAPEISCNGKDDDCLDGDSTTGCVPQECIEDDSGALDIEGTGGKPGDVVRIPVRVQDASGEIRSFGFKVSYDPDILKFTGNFERGYLTASFDMFGASPVGPGQLKVAGMSAQNSIPGGAGGYLVWLEFDVVGGLNNECCSLQLESLKDDLALFSKTGGCFCVRSCNGDLNDDGEITPLDALIAFRCFLESASCFGDCTDVNQDGEITPRDALCLFQKYLEQPSCLD